MDSGECGYCRIEKSVIGKMKVPHTSRNPQILVKIAVFISLAKMNYELTDYGKYSVFFFREVSDCSWGLHV